MLKFSRPLHLLFAALTYLLGASIPAYLGRPFQPVTFALGLAGVLLAQAGMALLGEVFRPHNEPLIEGETPKQKETLRNNMMILSIGMLATDAIIAFIAHLNFALTLPTFYFLLTSIILILVYAIPPFRLINRGFGELALALHVAYVIPSIGYLFQTGENSRLLTLLLIPLTALALVYFLVANFVTFSNDQKYERGTLLRLLTWERAVPLHHSLVAFAYLMFALVPLFGYSVKLVAPAFLTLPFAIFQIFQIRAIANGSPPNWRLLTSTALAVFGLTTYFLTLTFWLR
ncbi:MAG: UbiA family prenyltransferase [Anaerolineales bacterium]|nr:UbiA family prenyltransferase [Anaerolineales bacterium]